MVRLSFLLLCGSLFSHTAAQHIEFDSTGVIGKPVTEGTPFVHTFTFRNTGDSTLLIRTVEPGCKCTSARTTRDTVPPGDTGAVIVTFNTKGRPGLQSKGVTVRTNDPGRQWVGLRFTVEVVERENE